MHSLYTSIINQYYNGRLSILFNGGLPDTQFHFYLWELAIYYELYEKSYSDLQEMTFLLQS